jgi:hypothetical protein
MVAGDAVPLLLLACGVLLLELFLQIFALAVGLALTAQVDVGAQLPLFWGLLAVTLTLAVLAILVVANRRWVSLVLALVLASAGGVLMLGTCGTVRDLITPTVELKPVPAGGVVGASSRRLFRESIPE